MFKVGDKVVCVNNTDNEGIITLGKTYTIAYVNDDDGICNIKELPAYDWFLTRFQLVSEVDPLVEIRQSEYTALIEEINLLQELLAEANIKLAGLQFKPVTEYTLEDWQQARDKKWVFELYNGTEVFVQGIMDEFNDSSHPVELSTMFNKLHECTVTVEGFMWYDEPKNDKSVKRRIK